MHAARQRAATSWAPPSRSPSTSPLQRLYLPLRELAGPRGRLGCPAARPRPQRAFSAQSPAAAGAETCCCGRPFCVDASGEPQGADGQPKQAALVRELRPGLHPAPRRSILHPALCQTCWTSPESVRYRATFTVEPAHPAFVGNRRQRACPRFSPSAGVWSLAATLNVYVDLPWVMDLVPSRPLHGRTLARIVLRT